jgi:hypothetical protein
MSSSICKKNATVPRYCDSCDQTYPNGKALSKHKQSAKHKLNLTKVAEIPTAEIPTAEIQVKKSNKKSIYVKYEEIRLKIYEDIRKRYRI